MGLEVEFFSQMTIELDTSSSEAGNFYGRNRVVVRDEPEFVDVFSPYRRLVLPSSMEVVRDLPRPEIHEEVRVAKGGNEVDIIEHQYDAEGRKIHVGVKALIGERINERDIWVNPHNLSQPVRLRWVEGNPIKRAIGAVTRRLRLTLS